MTDMRDFIAGELHDKEARQQYARELLDAYIAMQIKALRQQRGWSQAKLGRLAGKMRQSQISPMEQLGHKSWKVSTLRRLAEALDLALVVRFESFGRFLDEVSALDRSSLERPSFAADPAFRQAAPQRPVALSSLTAGSGESNVVNFPLAATRYSAIQLASSVGEGTVSRAVAHG